MPKYVYVLICSDATDLGYMGGGIHYLWTKVCVSKDVAMQVAEEELPDRAPFNWYCGRNHSWSCDTGPLFF